MVPFPRLCHIWSCGPSHKRLWNINVCVVLFLPLTPSLPHPPDSSSVPAFSDREGVKNSEQEEPLPLLLHCNVLSLRPVHHWKTQVRHTLLHHWKTTPVASPASSSQSSQLGSVTAYTSGPSSTCGKKNKKNFFNLKLFKKKTQTTFNNEIYIYYS